jgi:hypothetical protein
MCIRRHQHQVQTPLLGSPHGIAQSHNAQLGFLGHNAHFVRVDLQVDR